MNIDIIKGLSLGLLLAISIAIIFYYIYSNYWEIENFGKISILDIKYSFVIRATRNSVDRGMILMGDNNLRTIITNEQVGRFQPQIGDYWICFNNDEFECIPGDLIEENTSSSRIKQW